MALKITIETTVDASLDEVWQAWNDPEAIVHWNAASEDWHCPSAQLDLRVGGRFNYRMEARDGSMGFDFEGEYRRVEPQAAIEFEMSDGRGVTVEFLDGEAGVTVRETFEAESENEAEMQRQGWQAILDRFKQHVESRA